MSIGNIYSNCHSMCFILAFYFTTYSINYVGTFKCNLMLPIKNILKLAFLTSMATVLISCSSQKEFITDSDYSYTGKFKKYQTFNFAHLPENDSLTMKGLIEETIISKLQAQGFRYVTKKNPDLLIVYKIYIQDFNMSGYDQPNMEVWVGKDYGEKLEKQNEYGRITLPKNVKAEYDDQTYLMKKGTLLVSFYDRKGNKSVWQGYASGIFDRNQASTARSLKLAAHKIVREFRLVANGYVAKRSDS